MSRINSKFSFVTIFLFSVLLLLPIVALVGSYNSPKAGMVLPIVFLIVTLLFLALVSRTRVHKIIIEIDVIAVKKYFGLGKAVRYRFSDLDGFATLTENGKLGLVESIFIIKDGKRVGSISSLYHKNFQDLKSKIYIDLKNRGDLKANNNNEIAELFK